MSTTFKLRVARRIPNTGGLYKVAVHDSITRGPMHSTGRDCVSLMLIAAFDSLSWYMALYEDVGGEGWLELAYGKLQLIDALSSLQFQNSRF